MTESGDALSSYLSSGKPKSELYLQEEVNEFLLGVYNILKWAIRDKASLIVIRPTSVTWGTQDSQPNTFEFFHEDFRPYFDLVCKKDRVIGLHLSKLKQTDEETVFRID